MISGGNKVQKIQKTKFRKTNEDFDTTQSMKSKKHDKSVYRLFREEQDEFYSRNSKTYKRT